MRGDVSRWCTLVLTLPGTPTSHWHVCDSGLSQSRRTPPVPGPNKNPGSSTKGEGDVGDTLDTRVDTRLSSRLVTMMKAPDRFFKGPVPDGGGGGVPRPIDTRPSTM